MPHGTSNCRFSGWPRLDYNDDLQRMSQAESREPKRPVSNGYACGGRIHFDIIADSISQIIARSSNESFQIDAKLILKINNSDLKVMQRRILRQCERNYDDATNIDST